jgi:hypothetical protein
MAAGNEPTLDLGDDGTPRLDGDGALELLSHPT